MSTPRAARTALGATLTRVRLAVHTDFEYHSVDGQIQGEQAFTLFLVGLAEHVDRLVLLGRLDPASDRGRYPLGSEIEFVPLPFYESLTHVRQFLGAGWGSLRRFWRILDDVDVVWLLGPHPLQVVFAALATVRRRRLAVGVRQDFPSYVATRHPGRRFVQVAGRLLEVAWRWIARYSGAVVVGPDLARRYHRARRLLEITASLVRETELASASALDWASDGVTLRLLSVGRIDAEKNPLLLADALARLREDDERWRLVVVGEGPMTEQLAARLDELGLSGASELPGYVPFGPDLMGLYRQSDVLLHVSWTEGLPQVLIEAFASAVPVVATDVGGIREAVGEAALLIPPGDAGAAASAVGRVTADPALRARLVEAGLRYARDHTLDAEAGRVADFLAR